MKLRGIVRKFDHVKGFGFIEPDGGGMHAFVHHTDIVMEGYRTLAVDQRVEYETLPGPKGLRALNVTSLEPQPIEYSIDEREGDDEPSSRGRG